MGHYTTLNYANHTIQCFNVPFTQIPLGLNPSASCYLVRLKNVSILFDCGAELSSLLDFAPKGLVSSNSQSIGSHGPVLDGIETPSFDELEVATLDYILITNFYNMACLPYLTEYLGFKGKIFATEPTVQLGRQLLMEFSQQLLKPTLSPSSLPPNRPSTTSNAIAPLDHYRKMYTESEIASSFSKISPCAFDEQLGLHSGLTAIPHSSGYCLGACNWVIRTEYEKVVFSAQSVWNSSSVRFHSQPMYSNVYANADCVILSQLALPSTMDLDAYFGDLCSQIGQTLALGGNVLLPVSNAGLILDLFAILDTYMVSTGLNPSTAGLATAGGIASSPAIAMYYVSSISESVLAYANISAEWLDASKQERVYTPNNPFTHADLIETSRLFRYESIDQFFGNTYSGAAGDKSGGATRHTNSNMGPPRSPCIVFCGHPSLRFGESVALVEKFKTNPKNTIIFTEPHFDPKSSIAPFEPCACRLHVCPIDTRLTYKVACDLMRMHSPRHLVVPKAAAQFLRAHLNFSQVLEMQHGDEIKLSLQRKYERGFISPELAKTIQSTHVGAGNGENKEHPKKIVASIKATVVLRDGVYSLHPVKDSSSSSSSNHTNEAASERATVKMEVDQPSNTSTTPSASSSQYRSSTFSSNTRKLYGSPVPLKLLAELEEMGINDVQLESVDEGSMQEVIRMRLPQLEATLEMHGTNRTKIVTKREDSRKLLKALVLKHLS